MNFKKIISLLLIFVFVFALFSCEKEKVQYKNTSFAYFDTVTTIIGYETSEKEFTRVSGEAVKLLGEYHRLYDIYNEYEGIVNICTLNKLVDGEHQTLKVDKRIIDMLLYAKEMYNKTNGKMNIAMGSVLSIWHDYRTAGIDNPSKAELPPMELLEEAALHTDINNLIIDEENSTVYIADPKMTLDVGAVAKGYAVEMVARYLQEMGKTNYVVNVGGNIRTTGVKANGEKWQAGVESPDQDGSYIAYIELDDQASVTSGSYQRYYTAVVSAKCSKCQWVYDQNLGIPELEIEPGTPPSSLGTAVKCPLCDARLRRTSKQLHHIIDSETLMPAEGFLSVSLICENSADGDCLSTALFCMSLEDGMTLVNSLGGVEALWVTKDGEIHYSDNYKDYCYK